MPYIKSYSNYVLKKRHQSVSDGTIYERDITTIGGRDNFSKGQVPLYQSGNFVITVHNDNNIQKDTYSVDGFKTKVVTRGRSPQLMSLSRMKTLQVTKRLY